MIVNPAGRPMDAFLRTTPARAEEALDPRSVFDFRGLDKRSHHYDLRAFCLAPDGTAYSAYHDPRDGAGYLSARAADGALKWERPLEGVRHLQAAPDGSLRVLADGCLRAIDADGGDGFGVDVPGADDLQVDAAGTSWLLERPEGRLRAFAADGRERLLPEATTDIEFDSLHDGLLARRVNEVWDVASGEARLVHTLRTDRSSGASVRVQSACRTRDGGLALEVEETRVRGAGGMLFGPGTDVGVPMPSTFQRLVLVKPGGASWSPGAFLLEKACAESSTSVLVASLDGSRTRVERITPDGVKLLGLVSGGPGGIVTDGSRAVVHHASTVTLLGTERSIDPGRDFDMFEMRGFAPDGRLVIANRERVGLVDFETGRVAAVTNHDEDASWRLTPVAAAPPRQAPGAVTQTPDHVVVDGVRIPRRAL